MGNTVAVSVRVGGGDKTTTDDSCESDWEDGEYYFLDDYGNYVHQDDFLHYYATISEGRFGKNGTNARVLFKMDPRRDRLGQRPLHHDAGDNVCPNMVRGIDYLRDPRLNKGMAFTLEERQRLGIHGLLPPRFKSQEEQVRLCKENVARYSEDLNKHIYLVGLQDRNERLFYRLISENVQEMLPLVYTPTVGLACQKFGLIFRRPRGLFISIHDKGHVYEVLKNWPENDVRAVVVTDGERILGLGDLGAYGMGIPVGKLSLYTALAGIPPNYCLPILLDVGTNTQSLLDDPYYIGLNHKRITGPEYDEFIDEFMQAVVRKYGQNTLIQFEDFANQNAHRLLDKYRNKYCTFNDDIQGTASVVLAGVLASLKISKMKLIEHKFLFLGAGEAACGIADLIYQQMLKEGATSEQAASRIFLCNKNGLLSKNNPTETYTEEKILFLKDMPHMTNFAEMVEAIKPTAIFGAAAAKNAFTPAILNRMAELNERPIIFALSNPTSKAECTAEEAYDHTDGRAIFASGSPFPIYDKNGRHFEPGQGNNAYVFPGIALATITAGIHHISDNIFLLAAEELANLVSESDLKVGRLYPPLDDIKAVSMKIATKIVEDAYKNGYAFTYPEPKNKLDFIQEDLYDYHNRPSLCIQWNYPKSVTSFHDQ
ncbi:NADP-dependent malic enzyme isoform X1 [Folsomia candida]|uniref:NADP-dependent malic enzyme isoform X1 n=1 Tax=Folsomia candida TaxID=158441 RepID=UPI0016051C33|nr:NADP-dependent malic enzyme isoform X1 [Folsomia candida]